MRNKKVRSEMIESAGVYECVRRKLYSMGYEELNEYHLVDCTVRKLPRSKKKIIRRVLKDYQRAQDEEYKQLYRDVYCRLFEYPVRIFKIFTKGAAIGMSVAGIVNTIAPNLFPTALGYIAGSMSMNILVKIGMVSVGVFSPPVFTRGAILYIGAAVGAVIYAIFKLGFICVRGTYRLAKRPSKIPKGARGT